MVRISHMLRPTQRGLSQREEEAVLPPLSHIDPMQALLPIQDRKKKRYYEEISRLF